jgi:hypothetical protein
MYSRVAVSNNATFLEVCCTSLNGSTSRLTTTGRARTSPTPVASHADACSPIPACTMTTTIRSPRSSRALPSVTTIPPSHSATLATTKGTSPSTRTVWLCDLAGNYTGSNPYENPSRAEAVNGGQQVGVRFSVLAGTGIVSLFALKASAGH